MELLGATYNAGDKETRFVFITPSKTNPSSINDGKGVILVMKGVEQMLVPGDETDYREITHDDLEAYADALCSDGPIKCGIGIADNRLQIVEYDGARLMFSMSFRTMAMTTDVSLNDLPTAKEE